LDKVSFVFGVFPMNLGVKKMKNNLTYMLKWLVNTKHKNGIIRVFTQQKFTCNQYNHNNRDPHAWSWSKSPQKIMIEFIKKNPLTYIGFSRGKNEERRWKCWEPNLHGPSFPSMVAKFPSFFTLSHGQLL